MKKLIFLVVGMVLCFALVGGALAVNYYSAPDKNGTLTADSCIKLSLDKSTNIGALELDTNDPKYYEVVAEVNKTASVAAEQGGTLTITLSNLSVSELATKVKVDVYSDMARTDLLQTQTGAGSITIEDVTTTTSYYLTISLLGPEDDGTGSYDAAALAAIGGKLNVNFVVA